MRFLTKQQLFTLLTMAACLIGIAQQSFADAVDPVQNTSLPIAELVAQAEKGDAESQYQLGKAYEHGLTFEQDYKKAAHWYLLAANQGHSLAQEALGYLYATGKGAPNDFGKARDWFKKSAMQGNAHAQVNLAVIYFSGFQEAPQDLNQAAKWFLKAANQADSFAQHAIGVCYMKGWGVPEDNVLALKWFTLAVDHGNDSAKEFKNYIVTILTAAEIKRTDNLIKEWYAR